jgi:hypothetical protein
MPTALGVPINQPTGRKNMLASIRYYLATYLPGYVGTPTAQVPYTVEWEQYFEAGPYPCITFQDFGIPNLGGYAFADIMGTDANGVTHYGKKCQTMIEINCMTDQSATDAAIQNLYQMSDQLEFLFHYASNGQVDDNGVQIMPPIALLDFDNGNVDTGARIECPQGKDAIWMPTYIGLDNELPNVKRLSIKTRIIWDWLRPLVTSQ